jgi:hypothetical protein
LKTKYDNFNSNLIFTIFRKDLILKYISGLGGALATGAGLHSYYLTHIKDISNIDVVDIINENNNLNNLPSSSKLIKDFNYTNLSSNF